MRVRTLLRATFVLLAALTLVGAIAQRLPWFESAAAIVNDEQDQAAAQKDEAERRRLFDDSDHRASRCAITKRSVLMIR